MVLSWKEHPALNQQTREWLFVFPCTGGEGATTLGFLSHPLHLTQGRGQAQTHAELHIYMEGARNWNNKSFGLCLSPLACQVEWAMGDSWHAWRSPLGCTFMNALSQHLLPKRVALWCLTAPGYLLPPFSSCAITPKSIGKCSWTTTNQATTTERKLFF